MAKYRIELQPKELNAIIKNGRYTIAVVWSGCKNPSMDAVKENAETLCKALNDRVEMINNKHDVATYPLVSELAEKFSFLLIKEIGTKIHVVIHLNNTETSFDVCHSHDFCDANVVMLEAWKAVMGSDFEFNSEDGPTSKNQSDQDLINQAWTKAKEMNFYI